MPALVLIKKQQKQTLQAYIQRKMLLIRGTIFKKQPQDNNNAINQQAAKWSKLKKNIPKIATIQASDYEAIILFKKSNKATTSLQNKLPIGRTNFKNKSKGTTIKQTNNQLMEVKNNTKQQE